MLGQVAVKDNSISLVGKSVAEVFDESNRRDSVDAEISCRAEAVVSTDTVDNAGIFVVNVVDDEHADSAGGDDVELASGLDFGLLPVSKEPVNFGGLVFDFAQEECSVAGVHPLVLNLPQEWLLSLKLLKIAKSLSLEFFESSSLGVHGILTVNQILKSVDARCSVARWVAWNAFADSRDASDTE
jgi:hypothetical protein